MNRDTASTSQADSGAREMAVALLDAKARSLGRVRSEQGWFERPSFFLAVPAVTSVLALVVGCVAVGIESDEWPIGIALLLPFAFLILGVLARISPAYEALLFAQRERLSLESQRIVARVEDGGTGFPGSGQLALRRAENLLTYVDLERRIEVQVHLRNVLSALLAAIPVAGAVFYTGVFRAQAADYRAAVVALTFAFGLAALAAFQSSRGRLRSLEAEKGQATYERNLLYGSESPLERAEMFFLKQEFEAKRYYDEQLRQSSMLAYLGVVCIGAGLVVIGAVLYALMDGHDTPTMVVLGVVGVAAGILTNFVAFVLVRMHAATVETLQRFHSRMADMQTAHLKALEKARRGQRHAMSRD